MCNFTSNLKEWALDFVFIIVVHEHVWIPGSFNAQYHHRSDQRGVKKTQWWVLMMKMKIVMAHKMNQDQEHCTVWYRWYDYSAKIEVFQSISRWSWWCLYRVEKALCLAIVETFCVSSPLCLHPNLSHWCRMLIWCSQWLTQGCFRHAEQNMTWHVYACMIYAVYVWYTKDINLFTCI